MSKSKKPRKKKTTAKTIAIKTVAPILDRVFQKIYWLGDRYNTPICFNTRYIANHLKGINQKHAYESLFDLLVGHNYVWTLWLAIWVTNPDGTVQVHTGIRHEQNTTLPVFLGNFEETLKTLTAGILVGSGLPEDTAVDDYGYLIGPNEYAFDNFEDQLIHNFFKTGVGERGPDDQPVTVPTLDTFLKTAVDTGYITSPRECTESDYAQI